MSSRASFIQMIIYVIGPISNVPYVSAQPLSQPFPLCDDNTMMGGRKTRMVILAETIVQAIEQGQDSLSKMVQTMEVEIIFIPNQAMYFEG